MNKKWTLREKEENLGTVLRNQSKGQWKKRIEELKKKWFECSLVATLAFWTVVKDPLKAAKMRLFLGQCCVRCRRLELAKMRRVCNSRAVFKF